MAVTSAIRMEGEKAADMRARLARTLYDRRMFNELLERCRPITLEDKALFDKYLRAYPQRISEYTFTDMFAWAEIRHHLWCEYDGHLLVSLRDEKGMLNLLPPIGPDPARILRVPLEGCKKIRWSYITEHLAHTAGIGKPHYERKNSDYVYNLQDLRELKGKKYDGKRNFIKRMAKLEPTVRAMTAADVPACLRMEEQWLAAQASPSAKDEATAMAKALMHFDAFGLHGICVFVGETLAGFAVGEPLNDTMFVEHFEKGLPEFTGIYPFVLNEFAKSIPARYTHLNREQDLGLEGLRKSKQSWNPEYLIHTFSLTVRCPHQQHS